MDTSRPHTRAATRAGVYTSPPSLFSPARVSSPLSSIESGEERSEVVGDRKSRGSIVPLGRGVSHCCPRHQADPSLRARNIPAPLEALETRCACAARTSMCQVLSRISTMAGGLQSPVERRVPTVSVVPLRVVIILLQAKHLELNQNLSPPSPKRLRT
ncbi:hypothetical protein B0H19DRAFT_119652 [Mycena capillaripes]|nr:hypothetical protein B0H19DRAFT_119652 [Mycena capillaripes]